MKTYGDLEIALSKTSFSALTKSIEGAKAAGWQRAAELERSVFPTLGGEIACFRFEPGQVESPLPAAHVWLSYSRERNCARVSNILPIERTRLSEDDYNDLLDRFESDLIRTVATRSKLRVHRSKRDPSLEDLIHPETAAALRLFSGCANKSTGSSHPCDRERWNQFLFLYHRKQDKLDPTLLREFLLEDGWSDDLAHELVAEFETAVELLRDYDRTRVIHA